MHATGIEITLKGYPDMGWSPGRASTGLHACLFLGKWQKKFSLAVIDVFFNKKNMSAERVGESPLVNQDMIEFKSIRLKKTNELICLAGNQLTKGNERHRCIENEGVAMPGKGDCLVGKESGRIKNIPFQKSEFSVQEDFYMRKRIYLGKIFKLGNTGPEYQGYV